MKCTNGELGDNDKNLDDVVVLRVTERHGVAEPVSYSLQQSDRDVKRD